MAPSLHASESPSEYSKRERKAIVLLTLAFVVLSTIAHFALGALYRPLPQPHDIAPQPHESTTWGRLDRQPAPTPTPTPPPSVRVVATTRPMPTGRPAHTRAPIAKPPSLPGQGDKGPASGSDAPGSPGPVAPESPQPSAPPEPAASFAPCRMTRKIQPDYPDWIKQAGIQGTAIVILSLGPNGDVLSARVGDSSGNAALDQAALAAARASGYECPPNTGRGGSDLYQVIYTFRLDS
jgi:periplasmic protein TonB